MNEELIKYAKGMEVKSYVMDWLEQRIDEQPQQEVEHIIDYLVSDKAPKKLERATYDQMKLNAEKWIITLNKKGNNIKESKDDIEIIKKWRTGFKFVKLIGENAYKREGFLMKHCISSYYGKDDEIYSLRDENNQPHCTISKQSQQIKGKGNGCINPKYIKYVVEFLEFLKVEVRKEEMKNLGYIDVTKWKKYLEEKSIKKLFKKKYWYYQGDKLITKNGDEFATMELWNDIPLLEEVNNELKCNFNLKTFIPLAVQFQWNQTKIKKVIGMSSVSGYSGKSSVSGDSGMSSVSGDYGKSSVKGKESIACVLGKKGQAKASKGSWIVLCEYDSDNKKILNIKSAKVDCVKLKENVWYKLKNNQFVEVQDE